MLEGIDVALLGVFGGPGDLLAEMREDLLDTSWADDDRGGSERRSRFNNSGRDWIGVRFPETMPLFPFGGAGVGAGREGVRECVIDIEGLSDGCR